MPLIATCRASRVLIAALVVVGTQATYLPRASQASNDTVQRAGCPAKPSSLLANSVPAFEPLSDRRTGFRFRSPARDVIIEPGRLSFRTPSANTVTIAFEGESTTGRLIGEQQLPGRVNYIRGTDPSHWRRDVATFASVRRTSLYPGIDVVYYARSADLEFDFVIAPGTDPSAVLMNVAGARSMAPRDDGALVIEFEGGQVVLNRPVAYQNGSNGKAHVACRYVKRGDTLIGLGVSTYDPSATLVVDPVVTFSTHLGGNRQDEIHDMVVDRNGNVIVVGRTSSEDFPVVGGTSHPSFYSDGFVTKISTSTSTILFSTYFGGEQNDSIIAVALSASGEIVLTGTTESADFPIHNSHIPGGQELQAPDDCFVTMLSADGTSIIHSSYLGGSGHSISTGNDIVKGVALDADGNIYVAGVTTSSDWPLVHPLQTSLRGFRDAFVTKLSVTGRVVYSTYLGGSSEDEANAITVDSNGEAIVTGGTHSEDFPVRFPLQLDQPGSNPGSFASYIDCFVSKLTPDGEGFVYSTYLGGNNYDYGNDIAVDADGAVYVVGRTDSVNFPTTVSAYQRAHAGSADVFVTKISASGNARLYSTFLGGELLDAYPHPKLTIDSRGRICIAGSTDSTDFPLVRPTQATNAGTIHRAFGGDAFVARFNEDGTSLDFATYLGGSDGETVTAIAVDSYDQILVAGYTLSYDFPLHNAIQGRNEREDDAFITLFGNTADLSLTIEPAVDTASTGGQLTYLLVVTNLGPESAGDVLLRTATPEGTSFVSATISQGTSQAPAPGAAGDVSCAFGEIRPGGTGTLTLTVLVGAAPGTTLTITAEVSSSALDLDTGNNSASNTLLVVDGPTISSISAVGTGARFRVKVNGTGFQAGASVFIGDDATAWTGVRFKSAQRLVLVKGPTLSSRFPRDVPVPIRVVNPDGGVAQALFTR